MNEREKKIGQENGCVAGNGCFKRKEGLLDKRVLRENWARERSKGATGQPRKKRTRERSSAYAWRVRKPSLTHGGGKKEGEGGGMGVSNDHSSLLSKSRAPGSAGGRIRHIATVVMETRPELSRVCDRQARSCALDFRSASSDNRFRTKKLAGVARCCTLMNGSVRRIHLNVFCALVRYILPFVPIPLPRSR